MNLSRLARAVIAVESAVGLDHLITSIFHTSVFLIEQKTVSLQ